MKSLIAVVLVLLVGCPAGPVAPYRARQNFRQTVQVRIADESTLGVGEERLGTGSGVVVWSDGLDRSVVVTARHVADPRWGLKVPTLPFSFTKRTLEVVSLAGVVCKAQVIYQDPDFDLSFLTVDCVAGEVATLIASMPEIGDWTYVIGAPYGFHPDGTFLMTDGRYIGGVEHGLVGTSAAVAPGNSGGGLFADGWLVGIVIMVAREYHHVVYCVPAPVIAKDLQKVREMLR